MRIPTPSAPNKEPHEVEVAILLLSCKKAKEIWGAKQLALPAFQKGFSIRFRGKGSFTGFICWGGAGFWKWDSEQQDSHLFSSDLLSEFFTRFVHSHTSAPCCLLSWEPVVEGYLCLLKSIWGSPGISWRLPDLCQTVHRYGMGHPLEIQRFLSSCFEILQDYGSLYLMTL